jgi:hypothetical protein
MPARTFYLAPFHLPGMSRSSRQAVTIDGVTEHQRSQATAADAVFALVVLGVRGGVWATSVLLRAARPATDVLLRPDRWPNETLRLLAEAGLRYRRNATADLLHRYHAAVPVVVADVLDQLDLAGMARTADVPRIVQEATASVVSENVRGVRLQAYAADRTVSRWVDRALGRDAAPR